MKIALPENWYMVLTNENYELAEKWRQTNDINNIVYRKPKIGEYLLSTKYDGSFFVTNKTLIPSKNVEITFEEFKKFVLNMKQDLPTKWYIEATKENFEELNAWRNTKNRDYNCFEVGDLLLSKHISDSSYYYCGTEYDFLNTEYHYKDYQKITLEQFRQITNSSKEIVQNKNNVKEFEELCRPLMKYIWDNFDPHTTILVTNSSAELLCSKFGTGKVLDYIL